jgi:hypothetical protein
MPNTDSHGRRRAAVCLPALLLACAGLAACGGSSSTTSGAGATTPASRSAAALRASAGRSTTAGSTSPNTQASTSRRSKLLPFGALTHARSAPSHAPRMSSAASKAFRQALVKFALCLRQNGVDIPAPSVSGKGPLFGSKGLKTNTPQFRSASAKCRATLLGALRQNTARARASTAAPAGRG